MTHDIITGGVAALSEHSEDGTLVNGVALGEGDITEGMSGKRTRWPKETLQDAAELLVGKPITKQLGESHVGAEKTDDGLTVDSNVPLEAKVGEVSDAKYKDGVGLLWQGEIKDPEMSEKVEQGLAEVSPVFARDIEPVEGEDGLFEGTAIRGFRDLGLVSKGASPSNSIQTGAAAMTAEALASAFDEPAESGTGTQDDDDPSGGEGQSTGTDGLGSNMDTDDITDAEFELLAAARQMDSPAVIEEQDASRLSEADELLATADETDNPMVVSEDDYDALKDNTETVRGVLEEALCERTDLRESTVEALTFEALAGEFENEDGEFDAEALVQVPETGDPEGGEDATEALSDDADMDKAEALYGDYQMMSNPPEGLETDIVEALGVDDFDAAIEVLN